MPSRAGMGFAQHWGMRTFGSPLRAGGIRVFAAIVCAGALCGGRSALAGDGFSPIEVTETGRPVRVYLTGGLGGGSVGLAVMGSANVEIGSLLLGTRVSGKTELFGPGLSTAQEMTAYSLLAGYSVHRGVFGFYAAAGLGLADSLRRGKLLSSGSTASAGDGLTLSFDFPEYEMSRSLTIDVPLQVGVSVDLVVVGLGLALVADVNPGLSSVAVVISGRLGKLR